MPNSILRFGPWAAFISAPPTSQTSFTAANEPDMGLVNGGYPQYFPVNCALTDWASGASWKFVAVRNNVFDYQYWSQDYFMSTESLGSTVTGTATGSIANVAIGFAYQATEDFTVDFNYVINSQLGFGGYGVNSFSVRPNANGIIEGSSIFYQGSNKSGTDTIDCPAGTMGFVLADTNNFGSDYPGDVVSAGFS